MSPKSPQEGHENGIRPPRRGQGPLLPVRYRTRPDTGGAFWFRLPPDLVVIAGRLLDISLIVAVLRGLGRPPRRLPDAVARLGRASLPLYLWHVLRLAVLWAASVHHEHPVAYGGLACLGIGGLTAFVLRR